VRDPPLAATDADAPLTAAEFAALLDALGPYEPRPALAVAVSGGPDSTALALLADAWARERGGETLALIVDHGLRPEAAAEATLVAGRLARAGIRWRTLCWDGPRPTAGIQAAARAARYGLLENACREAGILHLLLGHQRDDQAETVAIRIASGSGSAGRSGMPMVSEVRGLRLLRPLLAVPKSRLLATLRLGGQPWLIDPTNLSPRFHRSRLRRDPSFDVESHWQDGLLHAGQRAAGAPTLARWLAAHVLPHPFGFVRLDRAAWDRLEPGQRSAVLGAILATVGGGIYPARTAAVRRLIDRATAAQPGARWTAGGCLLSVRRDQLIVSREPGLIRDRSALQPGEERLWDGRFVVACLGGQTPVEVAALGALGHRLLPTACRARLRAAELPAAAVMGLPAFWEADRLVACPPLTAYQMVPQAGIFATATPRPALALAGGAFAGVNVVSKAQQLI
jgi:tRNA(Ile)-lysidine synthase